MAKDWLTPGLQSNGTYITGTGQRLTNVHEKTAECVEYGCVIHNPTDPHQEFPTFWRGDRGIMERICPHGVGHPDLDGINFIRRRFGPERGDAESVHGCCGCCARPKSS